MLLIQMIYAVFVNELPKPRSIHLIIYNKWIWYFKHIRDICIYVFFFKLMNRFQKFHHKTLSKYILLRINK